MHSNLCFLLELAEAGSGVLTSSEHRPPPTAEMLPPPPMIERRLLLRSTYQVDIVSYNALSTPYCPLLFCITRRYIRTVDTVDLHVPSLDSPPRGTVPPRSATFGVGEVLNDPRETSFGHVDLHVANLESIGKEEAF